MGKTLSDQQVYRHPPVKASFAPLAVPQMAMASFGFELNNRETA